LAVEQEFINYLIEQRLCTQNDIDNALDVQKKYHTKISTILLNLGVMPEEKMLNALSAFFEVERLNQKDLESITQVNLEGLTLDFLEKYAIYPFNQTNNEVLAALDINVQFSSIFILQDLIKKEVIPYLGSASDISTIKDQYARQEDIDEDLEDIDEDEAVEKLKELASEAPVIKMINTYFNKAVENKASDIHYESFKNGMYVRFRIDGILQTIDTIPQLHKKAVIARLKLLSKMNISENRLPQDGRISLKVAAQDVDIRASSVPTAFGESFVLRLLGKQSISYSLNALEFYDDHLELLRQIASKSNGIFLTTGPTGSGKTTTLYSLLNEVNDEKVKIITVEDPVEYELSGISQIQVKSQIDFTFANALRSILRQDPDVIMVGEIRDEETARISIQSSLTGHTVLSTLHTNSALGAITRLMDMNIEYFLLKSSINGLMAQRLVRKLCPHCKEKYTLPNDLETLLDIHNLMQKYPFVKNETFQAAGCDQCNHSGYIGRIPVAEVLLFDETVQQAMQKDKNFNDLNSLGYRSLYQDAILKFLDGKTSYEEIIKVS
jgi:general secretion pathway protein E